MPSSIFFPTTTTKRMYAKWITIIIIIKRIRIRRTPLSDPEKNNERNIFNQRN